MKKLIIFILAACMLCTSMLMAGCEQTKEPGADTTSWAGAFTKEDMNNVTLGYEVTFLSGNSDVGPHIEECKMVDGKMITGGNVVNDAKTIEAMQNIYLSFTKCIFDNKNLFQFDSKNNNYTCDKTISFEIQLLNYEATVSMSDLVVTFDTSSKLASFTCYMTQDIKGEDGDIVLTMNAAFTFSDYGTTKAE